MLTLHSFRPQLVELKSGETFNGLLIACDNFMNITLREVYQTSSDGDRFWKLPECYIKGATVSAGDESEAGEIRSWLLTSPYILLVVASDQIPPPSRSAPRHSPTTRRRSKERTSGRATIGERRR